MPALKHSKSYRNINKIRTVNVQTRELTDPITSSTSVEKEVGYDCDVYNPCTPENAAEGKFYFPHKDPTKYVQCSEHGQCYVMNCSSGLVWDSAINSCHWSPITTSTTSSPSTTSATTGVDGTTAIGTLIQYFSRFRSYLPSGFFMRKHMFDSMHFDKRTSWNSILQRTGNQWNDMTVKWNESEMTGSQFAGGLIANSASLCSTVFTALFHPLWLNCSYCLQTNQILEATGQPPNHPTTQPGDLLVPWTR